jgi:hypothetical protein
MKKLIALTVALAFCAGCVDFIRTQNDWVKTYGANGKQIQGPSLNVGNLIGFRTGGVDLNINTSAEEPAVVGGNSILSKTGLDKLNAAYSSQRGATNTLKTVGYDSAGFSTDVSTNAAPTVEAVGSAGGKLIKEAVGAP